MRNSRLEQIRVELGKNKTEFAEAIGVTPSYYYNILKGNGSSNLRLEHLENLLVKHKVNPAWILIGQGEKYATNPKPHTWIETTLPELEGEEVTEQELSKLMRELLDYLPFPVFRSDFAFALAARFCRHYMGKNPGVLLALESKTFDATALVSGFLVLLETAAQLVQESTSLEGSPQFEIHLEGQTYIFQDQPQSVR